MNQVDKDRLANLEELKSLCIANGKRIPDYVSFGIGELRGKLIAEQRQSSDDYQLVERQHRVGD